MIFLYYNYCFQVPIKRRIGGEGLDRERNKCGKVEKRACDVVKVLEENTEKGRERTKEKKENKTIFSLELATYCH